MKNIFTTLKGMNLKKVLLTGGIIAVTTAVVVLGGKQIIEKNEDKVETVEVINE